MARPAPPPALAFQDDTALQTPGPARDRLIAQMRRQGARNVRINAIYGKIKAEGYGRLDDEVNALRAAGIRPQVTIMGTPAYSPQLDQTLSAAHQDPRVWQQFAGDVARHFKGRVGRYSVSNEPNIDSFQAGAGANARKAGRQYRNVYRSGYAGIKHADPRAQVLLGEITSAPNARDFLAGVMGGKPLKTAGLAYHPYDAWITGGQAAQRNAWDINNLPDLQAALARYKRQGKLQTAQGKAAPLYLTEMGYFRGGKLNDRQRAGLMAQAYRKAQAAGARQLLSYQTAPTPRRTITDAPAADSYGNMVGGGTRTDPNWVWDTSLDPGMLAAAMRRPKASAARFRAAKARPVRKKR